jgi:hypothetical protein
MRSPAVYVNQFETQLHPLISPTPDHNIFNFCQFPSLLSNFTLHWNPNIHYRAQNIHYRVQKRSLLKYSEGAKLISHIHTLFFCYKL